MEAQANILVPVHEKYITYASSVWSGEAAYLRILVRAFADCKLFIPVMWFSKRAAKDQASIYIRTVSLEPSLITLKRRDVDEGSGLIVYISYVI